MVAGGEDCLWYVDKNGSWHPGFDCEFFTFCCGTCQQRYCCRDPLRLLTERQQRHCLAFSPKTIAGIASAVVLFIAIVTTIVCCFMCSCCYLYQRRQHPRTPLQGPEIPLSSYPPAAPPAPVPVDSKAGPSPPQPEPGGPVTLRLLPPQRHHPTSRHSPATPEHEPPRGPSHPPPASGTRLGTPGNPPGAGGGCPCQHWSRLFPALLG
ncbi:PREDICTED: protein shisa-4 [Ficedula albicollis]|uniref:protein shisa-4 n=1 Tax=Ficedula albicollis TaxID=59894 RepID=UPI0007AD7B71|nr:PREDICTED: protein shisa-4 [Ficedula albicollis]